MPDDKEDKSGAERSDDLISIARSIVQDTRRNWTAGSPPLPLPYPSSQTDDDQKRGKGETVRQTILRSMREIGRASERATMAAEKQAEGSSGRKSFSMSLDDTIFWIGLTSLGAGLYLMAEHPIYGLVLVVAGVAALAWANRGHMPKPPLRLGALILAMAITVGVAGYDLYDRRFGVPAAPIATGRVWTPLTDEQKASLGLVLSAFPKHDTFQIICLNSDCKTLSEDLMRVLYDAGWNPVLVGSYVQQEPYGAALYQTDINDRKLADAIEKATKLKVNHIYPSTIANVDSLFLGLRP